MFTSEQLTINFYEWEQRGRGWQVWDNPVELEPPFEPFGFHVHSFRPIVIDDGQKPTLISSAVDRFKQAFKIRKTESGTLLQEYTELAPSPFLNENEVKEIAVTLPAKSDVMYDFAEYLLLSLNSSVSPISFEILGINEKIIIQFACREPDISQVKQSIHSFFPEVIVSEGESLSSIIGQNEKQTAIADCGLNDEFMRPIRIHRDFSPDPLTSLFGTLDNLRPDEIGLVQVLFQGVQSPWASSILRSVRDHKGDSFFIDAPEMVKLAEEKVSRPLFSVVLRLIGQSETSEKSWNIVKSLYSGLKVFADPLSNELIPLNNDSYDDPIHLEDVIRRQSHRSGMLLNTRELLGFVHFPSASIISEKLKRIVRKTNSLPKNVFGHPFVLGENIHKEMHTVASLSTDLRIRHIHIIGKTGTGKSTLLVNLIKQDIEAGRGVAVLDPHGDLIDRIVERIPENRIADVILFDPSDTEYPVGFNMLEAHSEMEKTVLSSDLAELFRRYSTSWGDQMSAVLSNAISAIIESKTNGTIVELKRFLLEKEFRDSILKQNTDPSINYFWEMEYPLLKGNSQISIITRLNAFLHSKIIRNIIAQKEGINFQKIIESGKIFLAKLSQGIIGEENSHILGSLICSKLHQVVMGRQALDTKDRKPFLLYLDEFQNFATPSMASMLSGSRKFGFGLVLVHQDLQQIHDPALANSIISNPATRICFALGDNDAQRLNNGFSHFEATDLMNLGVGEAIVRCERNEYDFNLKTYDISPVSDEITLGKKEKIVAHTHEIYGKKPVQFDIAFPRIKELPAVNDKLKMEPTDRLERSVKTQPMSKPIATESYLSAPIKEIENKKTISQHRYLQTIVKKMAEERGFKATIEEPTPDGTGKVDVGLECNDKRIAVEISVTTGETQELHNIEKCLRAGYDPVIVYSPEKKNLDAIKKAAAEKLTPKEKDKVLLLDIDELSAFLNKQISQQETKETIIKGRRVKLQYNAISAVEGKRIQETLTQIVGQSLKRIKKSS